MDDLAGRRIWVAGHRGMVGGAMVRRLRREDCEIITAGRERLDLRDREAVDVFLGETRPDAIVLAAAKVGGILANQRDPVAFLHDNLMIAANVIASAHQHDVDRLLFLGSSCIYPKLAPQPIVESALLSGPLEETNEAYAIAKIAGVKLVQAYRSQYGRAYSSAMPTNLYGPGDNFDPLTSHVLPALLLKAHEAKFAGAETMTVWGSGTARREFLHVDDCADALVLLLKARGEAGPVNVGTGTDFAIYQLARLVAEVVGFEGAIVMDASKPDGTPRKVLDVSRLRALGWAPRVELEEGITALYAWFLANRAMERAA